MIGKIFINYRREDDPAFAGRLFDRLKPETKPGQLFIDVENTSLGIDFVEMLDHWIAQCDVVLVVIGPRWLHIGQQRLKDPKDFVRIEIHAALKRGKLVIPVLVNHAQMPHADDLPKSLKPLARYSAISLSHEHFDRDSSWLIKKLKAAEEARKSGHSDQHQRGTTTILTCKVCKQMKIDIMTIAIWKSYRPNECYKYLCRLALNNPNHKKIKYDGNKELYLKMRANIDFMSQIISYRERHALIMKKEFFLDALARGIAVHWDDSQPGTALGPNWARSRRISPD